MMGLEDSLEEKAEEKNRSGELEATYGVNSFMKGSREMGWWLEGNLETRVGFLMMGEY